MRQRDWADALVAELRQVITGGVATAPLHTLSGLRSLRSVRERLQDFAEPDESDVRAVVQEVIEAAINQRLHGEDKYRAQLLMGIGDYMSLPHEDRRRKFAETYGPNQRWTLLRQTRGTEALRKIALALGGRLVTANAAQPNPHGFVDWVDHRYWFNERGVIELVQSRRRILPLTDGIDRASFIALYYAQPEPGVISPGRAGVPSSVRRSSGVVATSSTKCYLEGHWKSVRCMISVMK